MNDTLNTIGKRYSCRNFNDKAVSDADLMTIADAAVQSPSGMNRQNWHISIVKDKSLLAEMEREGMNILSAYPERTVYARIMSRNGKLFYNAPSMAFISIKESNPKGAELIDLGIVAQTISLAATSIGVDNCHCGLVAFCFAGGKADYFYKKLLVPEGYVCGMGVLLGYAEAKSSPHTPDKSKVSFIG